MYFVYLGSVSRWLIRVFVYLSISAVTIFGAAGAAVAIYDRARYRDGATCRTSALVLLTRRLRESRWPPWRRRMANGRGKVALAPQGARVTAFQLGKKLVLRTRKLQVLVARSVGRLYARNAQMSFEAGR